MPWTPDQFRSRHAHDLSPAQSAHAAQIANAILRRSPGSEGMAIATGIARAKGIGRASGGTVDTDYVTRSQSPYWIDHLPRSQHWNNPASDPHMERKPPATRDPISTDDMPDWHIGAAFGGGLPRLGAGLPHLGPPLLPRLGSSGLGRQRSAISMPHLPHFDTGGDVSSATTGMYSPGVTASSTATADPLYQSLVQRYQGMSAEQLQEFVARAGNSSAGQVARRLLNQKRYMAGSQPGSSQQANQQTQIGQQPDQSGQITFDQTPSIYSGYQPIQQTVAHGGRIGLAYGGSPMGLSSSEADPWWTRSEARSIDSSGSGSGGFLHSTVAGRTDHIPATPAADSYVIPADVVSGLGEGNSLAGAHAISAAMSTAPWGQRLPQGHHGSGPPRAIVPRAPQEESRGGVAHGLSYSGLRDGSTDRVPAMLAGGEYVLTPEQVAIIGRGDVRRGHRVLDHFVTQQRARIIKQMQKLPGPVKA